MIRSMHFSPTTEWISAQEEFEAVCAALRDCEPAVRARRPAHYVRPTDRFLPVSLLRWTIEQIIATPFDELRASPGVGLVKIRNLAGLLRRVAASSTAAADSPREPAETALPAPAVSPAATSSLPASVDDLNEIEWRRWCSRIALHGLENELIGRLVHRLDDLSRSIWHTPLGRYCELTLEQLHGLKTYGERRTRVITATFRDLNQSLLASEASPGLTTTLGPELIAAADGWAVDVILGRSRFETHCYLARVVAPVLVQIRHDVGDVTYGVLLERFAARLPGLTGLCAPARRPGEIPFSERYSTSRLHQYRQDAAAIVAVRWPRGADLCRALLEKSFGEPGLDFRREIAEITTTLFPTLRHGRSERLPSIETPGAADAPGVIAG
jgi:hypothetical protein